MLKRALAVLFFTAITYTAIAQLRIKYNGNDITINKAGISYAFIKDNHFTADALFSILPDQWKPLESKRIQLNKLSTSIWLKIPVNSILQYGYFDFLKINNPHINFLRCWIISGKQLIKEFPKTGDNLTYNTRSLPVTNFDFPVNGENARNCFIVIAADKRYTNLSLPVNFCSEPYYLANNQTTNLIGGLVIGIIVLILFLNISLYVILRQQLFLWYSLYQFFILIYMLADIGILFKYVYPQFTSLNDLVRPLSLAFCLIPLIQFFNQLLDLSKLFPGFYRLNKWISIFYILLFIVATFSASSSNYATQGVWVQINLILSPALLAVLLYESIYCYYKKTQYAAFALLSYIGSTILIIIFSLHQSEKIPDNIFTALANYWAIYWELLVMCIALIWRYKYYKAETENLARANREQQEKIFNETVAFQEKEMQRISSLLHDSVGANLGLLRLEADNMKLTEVSRENLAKNITRLGNEVRMMSHTFSPILLQEKGLYAAIREMTNRIKTISEISLQFEWIGEFNQINSQFEIVIYRIIQEILQNLLKHSKAKNAFLQIIVEQNVISIYAEDDGVGLQKNVPSEGVGLKSIEKLVKLLNGSFSIESSKQEGFNISVEFNQYQHEKI